LFTLVSHASDPALAAPMGSKAKTMAKTATSPIRLLIFYLRLDWHRNIATPVTLCGLALHGPRTAVISRT